MLVGRLRESGWAQFVLVHLVVIGAPVCVMVGAGPVYGQSIKSVLEFAVSIAFGFTSVLIMLEATMSIRRRRAPGVQGKVRRSSRILTVILVAYLPNEQEVIIDSALAVLRDLDWPVDHLQLIVAYNTPDDLPVEDDLHELAAEHEALEILRVHGSTSKAENLIAAIEHARGHVTAIIDSDHRLHDQAANRAMRWFDEGYDVVQGRCVVRNPRDSFVSGLVSIEFEQIYGLAHAGRSLLMDTAIFGGANGWWRTTTLRQLGFDKSMLTEDIDASMRAMLAGFRIIHDRSVMTTELAPTDWTGWWKQRTRWAQGWFQVTMRHQRAVMRSKVLSIPLKLYWSVLLTWRELFPLIAIQVMSLILADLLNTGRFDVQFDPLAGFSTVLTVASGGLAAWGTWRLSTPETREAHGALRYALFGLLAAPYTMLRNTVALVALAREALGDHRWVVTTRKPSPSGSGVAAATVAAVVGALALGSAHPATAAAAAADHAGQHVAGSPVPNRYLGIVERGEQPTTLTSTNPQQNLTLEVPGTWTSISGTLTLRLRGAAQLSGRSRLSVLVNGTQVAASVPKPGDQTLRIALPSIDTPAHQVQVSIVAQLRTTLSECPPPGDPTAVLQIREGSGIVAVPKVREHVTLADLPGALVDARDNDVAKVAVKFLGGTSPSSLRAAGVATGAISQARGFPGVQTSIVTGTKRRATVVIADRHVPATLRVTMRRGRPTLTISGHGQDLVDAALLLLGDQLSHERRTEIVAHRGIAAPRQSIPKVIALGGASQTSPGTSVSQVSFAIPGRYEVQRGAHLRFTGSVEAPGNTRVTATINGRRLVSRTTKATSLPLDVDTLLADRGPSYMLGDLRPGDNSVGVKVEAIAAPVVCATQANFTTTINPAGSVTLRARARPISHAALDTWPFPMDQAANWQGSAVVLPADPTDKELATIVSVLGEGLRITGEPALPEIRLGMPARLTANTLVLARAEDVPDRLADRIKGGADVGTLASITDGGHGVVLAVGSRALIPLANAYAPERLAAITADVDTDGELTVRTSDTRVATATIPGRTSIRWPLLILGLSLSAMFVMALVSSLRRNARTDRPTDNAPAAA
ncbi:MAG: glycosyltransferase [Patulibacter minatonensis]